MAAVGAVVGVGIADIAEGGNSAAVAVGRGFGRVEWNTAEGEVVVADFFGTAAVLGCLLYVAAAEALVVDAAQRAGLLA